MKPWFIIIKKYVIIRNGFYSHTIRRSPHNRGAWHIFLFQRQDFQQVTPLNQLWRRFCCHDNS